MRTIGVKKRREAMRLFTSILVFLLTIACTKFILAVYACPPQSPVEPPDFSASQLLPPEVLCLVEVPALGKTLDEIAKVRDLLNADPAEATSKYGGRLDSLTLTSPFREKLNKALGLLVLDKNREKASTWQEMFPGPAFYALVESEGKVSSVFAMTLPERGFSQMELFGNVHQREVFGSWQILEAADGMLFVVREN